MGKPKGQYILRNLPCFLPLLTAGLEAQRPDGRHKSEGSILQRRP